LDDYDIDEEEGITQRKAGKKNKIAKKEDKGVDSMDDSDIDMDLFE